MKVETYLKARDLADLIGRIKGSKESVTKQIESACKKNIPYGDLEPPERPMLRKLEDKLLNVVEQHFAEELENLENEFDKL